MWALGQNVCACFNETKDDGNKVTRVKLKTQTLLKYMECIKCANRVYTCTTSYK